jgi:hypothetical protein
MSNTIFHNKFHRRNHDTVASAEFPDSATDPIASATSPFIGNFYNVIQNELFSYLLLLTQDGNKLVTQDNMGLLENSSITPPLTVTYFIDTYSITNTYYTVKALSADWMKFNYVYGTVNLLSAGWNEGYSFYLSFSPNSAKYESTYSTLNLNSASWLPITYFARLGNVPQQDIRYKGCTAPTLSTSPAFEVVWNLDNAQTAFVVLTSDVTIKNPINLRKGGKYTISFQQDFPGNHFVRFENKFILSGANHTNNTILPGKGLVSNLSAFAVVVADFTCDGQKLYGKYNEFYYGLAGITHFAGPGIILTPNPCYLIATDPLISVAGSGLTINGEVPYTESTGMKINYYYP